MRIAPPARMCWAWSAYSPWDSPFPAPPGSDHPPARASLRRDVEPAVKAVAEYGITIVAVVVLALAVGYFIRDLKSQRDRAMELAESAVAAFDRLVDQLGLEPVVKPGRPREPKP